MPTLAETGCVRSASVVFARCIEVELTVHWLQRLRKFRYESLYKKINIKVYGIKKRYPSSLQIILV